MLLDTHELIWYPLLVLVITHACCKLFVRPVIKVIKSRFAENSNELMQPCASPHWLMQNHSCSVTIYDFPRF